ncbi:MAG: cyclic pyranopterin monophosphate synthase MoaC [Limnochordaceae bacterium]|uniref:Cyclic pyranopterin monophosphate synthase n=1 Tax=Carboxydichorda subterranea TaxID=3109565 RepID=A0ABZ1BU92_9FIRM|nr:cyclic pyranopterin monophosphate synthase MoaC [Limnochorda sp. L945t]MBE3597326.1 cyclic pyranopterin monophosphate synthase MoaC [Limnochordaceae bacterium]WRP16376.1 cyclic pyranopterin monophosphate synthase MoaC [Limnochorda sp. L945t]
MEGELTHLDDQGRARMVDVSGKDVTLREAVARGYVEMGGETLQAITQGRVPKGDVLAAARIAGTMAAKRTAELIPLCHAIPLSGVEVHLRPLPERQALEVEARVKARWVTGVEMEALTAVCVAALTVYDMAKALDRGMRITGVHLVEKSGGRSGAWKAVE